MDEFLNIKQWISFTTTINKYVIKVKTPIGQGRASPELTVTLE